MKTTNNENKHGPNVGFTGSLRQLTDTRGNPDIGRIKRNPLPEGEQPVPIFIGSKRYCPDQNGNIHWQENYYLPSALADGYGFAVNHLAGNREPEWGRSLIANGE